MAKNLLIDGDIYLYGDVGDAWGDGSGFTAVDVAQALAAHGHGPVTVRLNSGGGLAFEGMAIYSLLKSHPGVAVVVDGVAASAASLIAMAGVTREMRTGAMLMIHDPSGLTWGPAKAHEETAERLHKLADNYARVYAQASGQGVKAVREMMLATTWMSAEEAERAGFLTGVLKDEAVAMAAFDYRIYANAPKELPLRVRDMTRTSPAASAQPQSNAAARARMEMRQRLI